MWVLWKNLNFYSSRQRALCILENVSALVKPQAIILEELFYSSLHMNESMGSFPQNNEIRKISFYVPQILSKGLVYQHGTPYMAYEP